MPINKIIRRKFLSCRVSSSEKSIIENDAQEAGKDVSTYVREILLANSKSKVSLETEKA